MNENELRNQLEENLSKMFGLSLTEANLEQLYKASATTVNDVLRKKRKNFNTKVKQQQAKRVYYLCMEFLLGRSLKNNLHNLDLVEHLESILTSLGYTLEDIYALEPDAGLGNGGLGRLAACYMDGFSSQNYPAMGYSLRYEYGLFKQKIINNWQTELPDVWLPGGEVWLTLRSDKVYNIRFGGRVEKVLRDGKEYYQHLDYREVEAVPYDLMVSGAESEAVSVLRLWRSQNIRNFNLKSFTQGNYLEAMKEYNEADLITKILYPADDHPEGKELRLKQQYFLVSASVQNIVQDHLRYYGDIHSFADHVAIHINDTHPALCIPELMRIFIDEFSLSYDEAWNLVTKTVNFTNHTVMSEALERWPEGLVQKLLPRIYLLLQEINQRFMINLRQSGERDIEPLLIIHNGEVRMANLCVLASGKVNGVSKLHTEIIKSSIFQGFYRLNPDKFLNVTNGIAFRRWLCQANPQLTRLIEERIGHDYYKNASLLEKLLEYTNDDAFIEELDRVKYQRKREFAHYLYRQAGVVINPKTRFDVQVKRIHEYKRQLLNALRIIALYIGLEENPNMELTPQTFIFGGKAAPSYYQAKEIIELINALAAEINRRPEIKEKLNLVFIEDYNVTAAEMLIPAAEVSIQISLAGKEASGTGNMKFMINGALTFGTLDGANVEIYEEVGAENIFLFGMHSDEVENLRQQGYRPETYYQADPLLRKVLDRITLGFDNKSFANITEYLLHRDPYFCLADFASFMEVHQRLDQVYRDRKRWNRMALVNIAKAGIFSADRSVREYAENIWGLKVIR
jgi:starch phosphorylase